MCRICRTCLKEITSTDFVGINIENISSLNSVVIKQELAICIPELDFNLVANAVVCSSCINDLHIAYDFKRKCLQTEERIRMYAQSNTLDVGNVELSQLLGYRHDFLCNDRAIKEECDTYNLDSPEEANSYGNPSSVGQIDPMSEDHIKIEPILTRITHFNGSQEQFDDSECTFSNQDYSETRPEEVDTKIHICDICNEVFTTYNSFCAHKNTHSNDNTDCNSLPKKRPVRQVQSQASTNLNYSMITEQRTSKRKTFTIEDKVNLIRTLEGGKKISEVCRATGLATSTVCCIWKKKETILKAFEKNGLNLKRLRKPTHADVDEALLTWATEQQNTDLQLCSPLLKLKAEELARSIGNYDFVCSSGWLERFKARYNISFSKKKS